MRAQQIVLAQLAGLPIEEQGSPARIEAAADEAGALRRSIASLRASFDDPTGRGVGGVDEGGEAVVVGSPAAAGECREYHHHHHHHHHQEQDPEQKQERRYEYHDGERPLQTRNRAWEQGTLVGDAPTGSVVRDSLVGGDDRRHRPRGSGTGPWSGGGAGSGASGSRSGSGGDGQGHNISIAAAAQAAMVAAAAGQAAPTPPRLVIPGATTSSNATPFASPAKPLLSSYPSPPSTAGPPPRSPSSLPPPAPEYQRHRVHPGALAAHMALDAQRRQIQASQAEAERVAGERRRATGRKALMQFFAAKDAGGGDGGVQGGGSIVGGGGGVGGARFSSSPHRISPTPVLPPAEAMALAPGAPPVVLGDHRQYHPPQEAASAAHAPVAPSTSTAHRCGLGSPPSSSSAAASPSLSSVSPRFVHRQLRLHKPAPPGSAATAAAAAAANNAAPTVSPPIPRVAMLVPGHRQMVPAVRDFDRVDLSRSSGSIVITERDYEYYDDRGASTAAVTAAASASAATRAAIAEAVAAAAVADAVADAAALRHPAPGDDVPAAFPSWFGLVDDDEDRYGNPPGFATGAAALGIRDDASGYGDEDHAAAAAAGAEEAAAELEYRDEDHSVHVYVPPPPQLARTPPPQPHTLVRGAARKGEAMWIDLGTEVNS